MPADVDAPAKLSAAEVEEPTTEELEAGALAADMIACNEYTNALAAASSISAPVTFVLGSEDKMTPMRSAAELIDTVADARVVRLESAGHFMPTENPLAVRDAIAAAVG